MASKKVYDLSVVVGQYQDGGQTKNRYQNIGVVMAKDDGGKFILLERSFNPAGIPHDPAKGNSIMVSMFEPKARDSTGGGHGAATPARNEQAQAYDHGEGKPAPDGFTDDIPF